MAVRTWLATAPTRGRSSAGEGADAAQDAGQSTLLAEDVELDRLEGRDVLARGDRRQRVVAQRLEVARQVGQVHVAL